jgi:hypothetical protein
MAQRVFPILFFMTVLFGCKSASVEIKPTEVTDSGEVITINGYAILFSVNNYCIGKEENADCLNELQNATAEAQSYFQDRGVLIQSIKSNFVICQGPNGEKSVVNVYQSSDCVFVCTPDGKIKTVAALMDFDAMNQVIKK